MDSDREIASRAGRLRATGDKAGGCKQESRRAGSEVLVVVHEVGLVLFVDELTGLLYVLGHSWRATAEHPDLAHLSGDWSEERPAALGRSLSGQKLLLEPGWNDQGFPSRP